MKRFAWLRRAEYLEAASRNTRIWGSRRARAGATPDPRSDAQCRDVDEHGDFGTGLLYTVA